MTEFINYLINDLMEDSVKKDLKQIKLYLKENTEESEIKWIKKLINKIGLKDFNLTFVNYDIKGDIAYIDLDNAYLLYQDLFD